MQGCFPKIECADGCVEAMGGLCSVDGVLVPVSAEA